MNNSQHDFLLAVCIPIVIVFLFVFSIVLFTLFVAL